MDTHALKNLVLDEAKEFVKLVVEGGVENDRHIVQPKNFDYEDTIKVLQIIGAVYIVDESDKDYTLEWNWPELKRSYPSPGCVGLTPKE